MPTRHTTSPETPLAESASPSHPAGAGHASVPKDPMNELANSQGGAYDHASALQDEDYFQRGDGHPPLRHMEMMHLAAVIRGAQTLVLSVLSAGILAVCGLLWASLLKLNDVATESAATKLALKDMRDELKAANEKVQRMWFEGGWEYHRAKMTRRSEVAAPAQ